MEADIYDDSDRPLARIAYEAYSKHTGGLTFDGRHMPKWNELNHKTKEAWAAAALAVVDHTEPTIVTTVTRTRR